MNVCIGEGNLGHTILIISNPRDCLLRTRASNAVAETNALVT